MQVRKFAYSAFLLSTGLYILLPTPDELVIYPVGALFFSYAFHIPILYGVLLTMIIYRSVGVASLLGALLVGGKSIYCKLKQKFGNRIHGGPYRI
jgi:hypothetical protein